MKATGIVRRIDELGRVVVPKELRTQLRIDEGDAIEIFTESNGGIVLKKFSALWGLRKEAEGYVEALEQSTDCHALITDKDQVIACSEAIDTMEGRSISNALKQVAVDRKSITVHRDQLETESYLEWPRTYELRSMVIAPIISPTGDLLGTVVLASAERDLSDFELKVAETAASFLSKQVGID
ncbi:MAG: AbrB/MazE/SpoVT family DNA-binding domain-containing protein [Firmicutes bacterium]|mgnify:CR=1 FL=1|nr:AbrB/MazE/SpoVT family DNA-binding domain-containing protein [Bacillota bacterium]